tara:strand:- start:369 stop:785 length:417 start_codon:yes stop_codon:yes gene_type:complete
MSTLLEGRVDFDYDSIDFDFEKLDADDVISQMPEVLQEFIKEKIRREVQDALTRVIALIYDSNNYRLKVATIVCAFGLPLFLGRSMREIAEMHGVTKQALSKSVKLFQKTFGLPPVRGQKSLAACKAYREIQLERNRK